MEPFEIGTVEGMEKVALSPKTLHRAEVLSAYKNMGKAKGLTGKAKAFIGGSPKADLYRRRMQASKVDQPLQEAKGLISGHMEGIKRTIAPK